jgi:uncharacterized delta-60 repeat protein
MQKASEFLSYTYFYCHSTIEKREAEMKPTLVLIALLFCFLTVTSNLIGQVQEAWVTRYDGPSGLDDAPKEMVVDSDGNVYVGGYSKGTHDWRDYLTIKYDTGGNLLWATIYEYEPFTDGVVALAVDGRGHVYVTGTMQPSLWEFVFLTFKYDSDGDTLWCRLSSTSSATYARDIAVDISGNAYVTGEVTSNYVTVKYDSGGDELWTSTYDGPTGEHDNPVAISFDRWGNALVTGRSENELGYYDFATVKYDTDGNELWVNRYGWGLNHIPTAMALDSEGNVYVTGYGPLIFQGYHFKTVKYSPDGEQLWSAVYNPGDYTAYARDIAVDNEGNVYITGDWENDNSNYDIAIVKYDTDGNQQWDCTHGAFIWDDYATAMALDSQGNVYVTGYASQFSGGFNYVTRKYDSDGEFSWVISYNGPDSDYDEARDIGVDSNGNVYVTGQSIGDGTEGDIATIKYRQNPLIHKAPLKVW